MTGGAWSDVDAAEAVCLSVDVEWAHPAVLADLVGLFDERGLKATFFCTGPDIDVGSHERGIHPNFRGDGDCVKAFVAEHGLEGLLDQGKVYSFVIAYFKAFAPEAKGVRGHSLHYDSRLMTIYAANAIEYDSSYQLPLAEDLRPYWKESAILELPIYYNDYFDLKTGASGFDIERLGLHRRGLKIFNVHPNIVFLNAPTEEFYLDTKSFYKDPDRLRRARHRGPGARDLLSRVLDHLADHGTPTPTLGELATGWRLQHPDPW